MSNLRLLDPVFMSPEAGLSGSDESAVHALRAKA